MSTTATQAQAQGSTKVTDQRGPGVVALSAVALVAGLAVWFFSSMIGHDGENTGTMVGIVVASVGLTFFFPALQTYLIARRQL
jgi:cation transporter-like permease